MSWISSVGVYGPGLASMGRLIVFSAPGASMCSMPPEISQVGWTSCIVFASCSATGSGSGAAAAVCPSPASFAAIDPTPAGTPVADTGLAGGAGAAVPDVDVDVAAAAFRFLGVFPGGHCPAAFNAFFSRVAAPPNTSGSPCVLRQSFSALVSAAAVATALVGIVLLSRVVVALGDRERCRARGPRRLVGAHDLADRDRPWVGDEVADDAQLAVSPRQPRFD